MNHRHTGLNPNVPLFAVLAACVALTSCAVNPVTGERHLQLYDTAWEQQAGQSLYEPMRQQQGGDFVLDPELTAYVRTVGGRLADHARRRDELDFEFQVINDSTPNAWALPGGKISVNRGLLTELRSEAELAAVLGHEIVHADAAHGARQQSKGVLTQAGAVAGMVLIGSQADSDLGKAAAVLVPSLGAQLLTQKYSRDAEREADDFGMTYMSEAGYDPAGAVGLQETFLRLAEGGRNDWLSGLFASHPPSRERVERNRTTAETLPRGGEEGRERYQQKTAYLQRVKPAYAAYDQALKLAGKKDFEGARASLAEALAIEPREALFHSLDGDLRRQDNADDEALTAYDRAISANPGYFYPHLRRGQLLLEQGESARARTDLERSVELLPTSLGHYLLGNLDRDQGRRQPALEHYRQAAASDSETGRMAQRELARLELGDQPGQYVATAPAATADGSVYCLLGNRSQLVIASVSVRARLVDDGGTTRDSQRTWTGALDPGARAEVAMGLSTTDTATLERRMQCTVVSAKPASKGEG